MGRELWVWVGLWEPDLILDEYTYVPWGMTAASYILIEAASHTGR